MTVTNVPGGLFEGAFVTGSEVRRFGLGVVQEIDAAAMHVFARWQHQEIDLDITGVSLNDPVGMPRRSRIWRHWRGDCSVTRSKIHQGFEDWDLFQVGGVIFF